MVSELCDNTVRCHQEEEHSSREPPQLLPQGSLSAVSAPSLDFRAEARITVGMRGGGGLTLSWAAGLLIVMASPGQAGQQPVPGRCDGIAGQCAEWEGLSHSEHQVTQTPVYHLLRGLGDLSSLLS